MWKQIYEYGTKLLKLKEQTDKNTSDIKEIREELKALTEAVRHLAYEIRRTQDKSESDQEKLVLRLENLLLRQQHGVSPRQTLLGTDDSPKSSE